MHNLDLKIKSNPDKTYPWVGKLQWVYSRRNVSGVGPSFSAAPRSRRTLKLNTRFFQLQSNNRSYINSHYLRLWYDDDVLGGSLEANSWATAAWSCFSLAEQKRHIFKQENSHKSTTSTQKDNIKCCFFSEYYYQYRVTLWGQPTTVGTEHITYVHLILLSLLWVGKWDGRRKQKMTNWLCRVKKYDMSSLGRALPIY